MPTTPTPRDTNRVIRNLERRIEALERSRATSTSTTAAMTSLQMGTTLAAPPRPIVAARTLSTGDFGFEVRRADDSVALRMGRPAPGSGARQDVTVHDKSGGIIVSDSGQVDGIGRPAIPLLMRPIDNSDMKSVSAAVALNTWTTLFEATGRKANGLYECWFLASCADGSTSGQARLVDEFDNPLSSAGGLEQIIVFIPTGTTAWTWFRTMACLYPGDPYVTEMTLRLQVQRTAGAAQINVRPGTITGGGD